MSQQQREQTMQDYVSQRISLGGVFERGMQAGEIAATKALREILALDPNDTPDGFNEWGESECFARAQEIAAACLREMGVIL